MCLLSSLFTCFVKRSEVASPVPGCPTWLPAGAARTTGSVCPSAALTSLSHPSHPAQQHFTLSSTQRYRYRRIINAPDFPSGYDWCLFGYRQCFESLLWKASWIRICLKDLESGSIRVIFAEIKLLLIWNGSLFPVFWFCTIFCLCGSGLNDPACFFLTLPYIWDNCFSNCWTVGLLPRMIPYWRHFKNFPATGCN